MNQGSRRGWRALARMLILPFAFGAALAHAQDKTVTIGYQTIVGPFPVAIANGDFEKATGYKINWRQFTSAGDISAAFASGDVPIGVLGSTGIAAATSNGVDV